MKLFLIYNSDGDTMVTEVTEQDILKDMTADESDRSKYLKEVPKEPDTNYWPEGSILLIRGEIVRPTPKKTTTVESWEITGRKE